ncbi:MAG: pirin family protein [Pseudomonadota bacterium]
MTMLIRRAAERGMRSLDWYESWFTFSFGDYYDPRFLGFGALRALNETRLSAGRGFAMAERSDLEILTYVCEGALRHRDDLGNDVVTGPGGVQRLSAGAGARSSKENASRDKPARFVQIWILPETSGGAPSFEAAAFAKSDASGGLRLLASSSGARGSVKIQRDVDFHAAALRAGDVIAHPLGEDREAWIQVLSGAVLVNGAALATGDGVGLQDVEVAQIVADADAEFFLFDMARG